MHPAPSSETFIEPSFRCFIALIPLFWMRFASSTSTPAPQKGPTASAAGRGTGPSRGDHCRRASRPFLPFGQNTVSAPDGRTSKVSLCLPARPLIATNPTAASKALRRSSPSPLDDGARPPLPAAQSALPSLGDAERTMSSARRRFDRAEIARGQRARGCRDGRGPAQVG